MINEYYYKKDFICVLLFNLLGSANCHITMHSYGKKSPVEDTPGIGQAETKEIILRTCAKAQLKRITYSSKNSYQSGNDR